MYIHNLDPILIDFGFIAIRWYSLAYIFGILIGWWLAKKILVHRFKTTKERFNLEEFDNLITLLILSIILGGRIGYILFYNPDYFVQNPMDVFKIWQGGMSFHGALIGIILSVSIFAIKKRIQPLFLLDIISCVAPIGIFFGRIANFINGELIGKTTNVFWSVIFPNFDQLQRHPSQLYEAFLEGFLLFIIVNFFIYQKNYRSGTCSILFLIFYGIFRIAAEQFREPDIHIGYIYNFISMGSILSLIMIAAGIIIFFILKKNVKH